MVTTTREDQPDKLETHRLLQLMNWIIVAAFGSAPIYGAVAFFSALPVLGFLGITVFCVGLLMLIARAQALRGRLQHAVLSTCATFFVTIIVVMLLLPDMITALVIGLITVVILALPYLRGPRLRFLMIAAWLLTVVIVALPQFGSLAVSPSNVVTYTVQVFAIPITMIMLLLFLWQFQHRLTGLLSQTQLANTALRDAQASLEVQVVDRTAALQSALSEVEARAAAQMRLLDENQSQRTTIRELSVPVLPISAGTLVMPLVGALDSERLQQIQERALYAIQQQSAQRLLLDITGVPVVDSQVAQGLMSVVQAARLLGAEVQLVGIRPEVAQAIVGLGLDLSSVLTASDLQSALGRWSGQ